MKFINEKDILKVSLIILLFLNFNKVVAQEVSVNQDPKFEQLLNEKRKVNSSITINNRYKIQLFNGSSEESKKTLIQFKKENKSYDATIVFSTPLYKVWVGNFKTRIEAERNLAVLKKKYPNAILIKPNK
ncbi:SPOR domain-containing protein [Flavobacterium sp. SUN052]|uniref:SPOR domain-containing protein n=1 Tax=Flavobacterium sp. SUN052 TaxID=3002441 RepID=UPI00237ECEC2|nr:SPOR domain-containing protein [Flavobacterium sp. SUN052]MEC4003236.1 SPOR domain-containing protein [Flavobacterium sp. SUN052]